MDSYNKLNEIAFKLMSEMTEEETGTEKSSMPEKRPMTFIKEMKGQFRAGEIVDVVKEGTSYNVFKKNVMGGAHPVKFNEKQAEEFFGSKLNEAFASKAGEVLGKGIGTVAKGIGSAAASAYKGAREKITGKTAEQESIDKSLKTMAVEFNKILKTKGITSFSDEKVQEFLRSKVVKPSIDKHFGTSRPAVSATKTPEIKSAASKEPKPLDADYQEEGFKPQKAKFVEKDAKKPKKAKEIGAFRKGKVGSGSKLPKE